jgi:hypothetical protein
MGRPFTDITLYAETRYNNNTPEYWEETALRNYISDLYIRKMHGYKPPNATRVSIDPSYYKIWDRTWKIGSIFSIAQEFIYEKYLSLDKEGKYKYVLDIIHTSMVQLSEEYNWDKTVFERAYKEVLENNFKFQIDYLPKLSRDKKTSAKLTLQKTDMVPSLYASFSTGNEEVFVKLLDKRNWWWYDSIYKLANSSKWFDNDRFGVYYKPYKWKVWYSLKYKKVTFEKDNVPFEQMNIDDLFKF